MSCSNCYNGCTDIVSDKCVRYTGVDVPILGIQTGDSLSYVEQSLIGFLTSTLDGTGIKPTIDPTIICDLVQNYLPTCGDLTLVDLINALIQAACDLQVQITALDAELTIVQQQIAVIEAPYTVGCLTGVTSTSKTHAILQAVITKLCAFILDVETNYVQIADLDALIQAYLDSSPVSTKYYTKMVPYTVVEYYGDIAGNFDATGAGIITGPWEKIYLCNGQNATPDKRGRVGVGVTFGTGMDAAVAPGGYNPLYNLSTKAGANSVVLTLLQIPLHTHAATVTPPSHSHLIFNVTASGATDPNILSTTYPNFRHDLESGLSYRITGNSIVPTLGLTSEVTLSVANTSVGGGLPHANNQPAIACYYIMYIP